MKDKILQQFGVNFDLMFENLLKDCQENLNNHKKLIDIIVKINSDKKIKARARSVFNQSFYSENPFLLDNDCFEYLISINDFVDKITYDIIDDGQIYLLKTNIIYNDYKSANKYYISSFSEKENFQFLKKKIISSQLLFKNEIKDVKINSVQFKDINMLYDILESLCDNKKIKNNDAKAFDYDLVFGRYFK